MITAEEPSGTSRRTSLKNRPPRCGGGGACPWRPPAGEPPPDESHREACRSEQKSDSAAGQGAFGGLGADELRLVVGVHVPAGERSPHDDPIPPVVFDERDLLRPGH